MRKRMASKLFFASLIAVVVYLFYALLSHVGNGDALPAKSSEIIQTQSDIKTNASMMLYSPPDDGENGETQSTVDPYADWESWCEEPYKAVCDCVEGQGNKIVCQPADEKGEPTTCPDSRTGRRQICLWPQRFRKNGIRRHECVQAWMTNREQKVQRETQGMIVEEICKQPDWWHELKDWMAEDEKRSRKYADPGKLCWRLKGGSAALKQCRSHHYCSVDKLHKFLRIPAKREVAWNNEKDHMLNADQAANRRSYVKMQRSGIYDNNPHYGNGDRWFRGYGWYGHNASLAVWYWDRNAPPEILCRQVESTEVHLRKMRRSFEKLWAIHKNKEAVLTLDTGKTVTVKGVTWYDLHRAASSGKLTREDPIPTIKKPKKVGPFVWYAGRVKLNPFETVMWEELGEKIPIEFQNDVADKIRQKIIKRFEKPEGGQLSTMSP